MDHVQAGQDFVFVYLDGVIGNCSLEEHLCHMRILFQWLQATGLVVNWEKCVFGIKEVEFLEHHVSIGHHQTCHRHHGASPAHSGE
jgi:hypothetical protein